MRNVSTVTQIEITGNYMSIMSQTYTNLRVYRYFSLGIKKKKEKESENIECTNHIEQSKVFIAIEIIVIISTRTAKVISINLEMRKQGINQCVFKQNHTLSIKHCLGSNDEIKEHCKGS